MELSLESSNAKLIPHRIEKGLEELAEMDIYAMRAAEEEKLDGPVRMSSQASPPPKKKKRKSKKKTDALDDL